MPQPERKSLVKSLLEGIFKRFPSMPPKPKVKLNPKHPTSRAIQNRRKRMQQEMDALKK